MKIIIWGTADYVQIARVLVKNLQKNIEILHCGVDSSSYKYNYDEDMTDLREMSTKEVVDILQSSENISLLLALPVKYLEIEIVKFIKGGGNNGNVISEKLYVVPSYLYRKKQYDIYDKDNLMTKLINLRPQLYYLEFHAADHCNLNCKGCSHFSNLVNEEVFLNIDNLTKDMKRLSSLFENIEIIRIMGGEPLLNKQLSEIISVTAMYFPYSKIIIVTNGLLIEKMGETLIETIKRYDVQITISMYPPIKNKFGLIENFLALYDMKYQFGERQKDYKCCENFTKFMNLEGKSQQELIYRNCVRKRCTFLYDGKLYGCALPCLIRYFNKYFNTDITSNDMIDLYESNLNGYQIIERLSKPMQMCKYCTEEEYFPWEIRKEHALLSDWIVE